jgi:hypothetical protein
MSTQNDFSRSFALNSAMSAGRRVAISNNGKLDPAGVGVAGIGVLQEDGTTDSWCNPKVRFYGTGSVGILGTGAPATAGDFVYAAATGMIAPTAVTPYAPVGYLAEGYTVNGSKVEVIPQPFRAVIS